MAYKHTLDESGHAKVSAAVSKAEETTDGEIVTIVAKSSDDYRETPFIWAFAFNFLFLSSLAIFPDGYVALVDWLFNSWGQGFHISGYMGLMFLANIILFFIIYTIISRDSMRYRFTPGYIKAARAHAKATSLFKVAAEHRTKGRTGVLIFLSLAEHRAEILADKAITEKAGAESWGEALAAMLPHVKRGDIATGMCEAVTLTGEQLSTYFPKTDNNPNELPDRLIEI